MKPQPNNTPSWSLTAQDADTECAARRASVLAHPDLAQRLTERPLDYASPEQWTGYIPPPMCGGRHNDSPVRAVLVEITAEAHQREGKEVTANP